MNRLQPQPAGLPSGRIGAPRGRAMGWLLRRLLAAPNRLAFAVGSLMLVASAVWWLASTRVPGTGLGLPWALPADSGQPWLLGLAAWPLFAAGLAATAVPRCLGLPPLAGRLLAVPVVCLAAGGLLAAAGLHTSAVLSALGLAIQAVGMALLACLLGLLTLEHRSRPAARQALPMLVGWAVLAVSTWVAAVAAALGQGLVLQVAQGVALWLGLVPVLLLSGAWPQATAAGPAGAGAVGARLRWMRRASLAWLGVAAGLGLLWPDLAAWPALLLGALGSAVMAQASTLAQQQAGRQLRIGPALWLSFGAAQLAVLAAVAASMLAAWGGEASLPGRWLALGGPLQALAAQFWLAAVVLWAWQLWPWLQRQPGDGLGG